MTKMLSNKKIINEIRQNQQDYINTRPQMMFKPFVNNRAEETYNLGDRIGGYKSLGQHPRYSVSVNGMTAFPDPLFGGAMYNNYLEFNKRYGGAELVQKTPLSGGYNSEDDYETETESESGSESESDYETESDSESESDYESESDSDSDSSSDLDTYEYEYEGCGLYDDYIQPAGKALYNVGQEVFKDVVVPVGKEILKDAIVGLMSGAGRMKGGLITGTKDEYIHILRKINPELSKKELSKKTKKKLSRELYQILEIGMHPDDLQTLHYLDALTKNYGQSGGLNGTMKELKAIIKAMYPNIDLKKMTKKEIINEIKREQPAKEIRVKREKVVKEPKEPKKRGRKPKVKEPKEPKKRGRKPKVKEPKEPKKRGRPKIEKPPKEPKKRGRKPKPKQTVDIIEDIIPVVEKIIKPKKNKSKLDKLLKTDKVVKKAPKVQKAPKAKRTKRPANRLTKSQFLRATKNDLFFGKLPIEDKEKVYDEYIKTSPLLEEAFGKKYFEESSRSKIFKKAGAGLKKIVGHKLGERVRGDVVAEVMKKRGLTLGEASRYVSEHNLY